MPEPASKYRGRFAHTPAYRGRFAPSPTGPLHFGSLVAALGSWLDARSRGGEWLVRMEDLDPPREVAGAADHILRTLERLALEWDGAVLYQSRRHDAYVDALDRLRDAGLLYPCGCTRKEIADSALQGVDGPVYPGTCREGLHGRSARALRLRVDSQPLAFDDAVQGRQEQNLEAQVGDFVLRRADGLFAYQLGVVVDDAAQRITHVVRGADLLDSTPRQIHLQRALGFVTPAYAHLPVAVNERGEKLSKQTRAAPVEPKRGAAAMCAALGFLGFEPEPALAHGTPREVLAWALEAWNLAQVPRRRALPATHELQR